MKRLLRPYGPQSKTELAHLQAFVESIPDMVWVKDEAGVFLTCNSTVERFFGAPRADILGKTDYDFVSSELADQFRENDRKALAFGAARVNLEWLTFASDGKKRLFETTKVPMRDAQGSTLGVLGVARDITERHEAKVAQDSLNRALKLIVKCHHAMMRAAHEEIMLSDICQLAVDIGGYVLAWVGFAERDDRKTVRPAAWSRNGEAYLNEIRIDWSDTDLGRGPVGTAIRSTTTTVNQDCRVDPSMKPWRATAEKHGYRSCIALPLIGPQGTFGALAIYAAESGAFGTEEIELLEELAADLAYGIQTLRTRTERDLAEHKLEFLAHHDALTGTPNRVSLRRHFARATQRADAVSASTPILLLDLDNFKTINDTLGHDYGDKLLIEASRRLQGIVADAGLVSRYGGDEFVVVLNAVRDGTAVMSFIRRLMAEFGTPMAIGEYAVDVTFSAGVSLYPTDATHLDDLIRCADTALQKAKDSGKNNFCFFDGSMKSNEQALGRLRAGLNNAIRNGEMVLHYQPQIDIRSGTITGTEALIRWMHPGRGMLFPADFIPLAERTGLIIPIGEWALNEACRQAHAWIQAGLPFRSVSVNVSALQVRRGNLLASVKHALQNAQLPACHLELELTESIFLHDIEAATRLLRDLHELGVKLTIDDFGVGYSSLSYLKELHVDTLKIDQSFLRDIPGSSDAAAIVKTIIQLAHNLNLTVIAEGVELTEQLRVLENFGCDAAQGYLFSHPLPADELACKYEKMSR